MRLYSVLSALLSYPTDDLIDALPAVRDEIAAARLPRAVRQSLDALVLHLASKPLLDLQAEYVSSFDRGRALSLHLFEHVHGQSRDRGQAMVDLINVYRLHGIELDSRELPDYLPLYLEFLAQVPPDQALTMLRDAMPVVSLLAARLTQRGHAYAPVLQALEAIAGAPVDAKAIRAQVAEEGPDETVVNMDKIWEEEAVTFLASPGGGCPSQTRPAVQPVNFVRR